MKSAAEWVPDATTGNTTSVDIAADQEAVWDALHGVTISDMPISGALLRLRLLPATLRNRSSSRPDGSDRNTALIESLTATRFIELYREDTVLLTLGVVGQFWKLSGGEEANVESPAEFATFDTPGFVRASIDFSLVSIGEITRLTTNTCNSATDPTTKKVFRRYWRVIELGSKFIRWELLRAVRSNAERT